MKRERERELIIKITGYAVMHYLYYIWLGASRSSTIPVKSIMPVWPPS
jgi:hypothetical protein